MTRPLPIRVRDAVFHAVLRLPRSVLQRLSGGALVVDGNELDAQVQTTLTAIRVLRIRESNDVAEARRGTDRDAESVSPAAVPMARERDLRIAGAEGELRARAYVPRTAGERPPLLVYFHGGGFVSGSIESHDPAVREIAQAARCAVLSVEYRLGPEHRFPAAPLDAIAAYAWAREHASEIGADPTRVGVGGDSAGGTLSAVVCHACRERGLPQPAVQLLIYPMTDWTRAFASHRTFAEGFFLEGKRVDWFEAHYLNGVGERTDPRASPLFYDDFSGLAPAIVVTAGFDILRDEGHAYADKLEKAGVFVESWCETALIHGFFDMSGAIMAARSANLRIARALRDAFDRKP